MKTPWGQSQSQKNYRFGALEVTFYETASHGGFLVSPDMLARMPEGLRVIRSFAGEGIAGKWYEEDRDWAIVVLAFPELFADKEIHSAVEVGNGVWKDKPAMPDVWKWLRSAAAAAVCEIAARYEVANGDRFVPVAESTGGESWRVSAVNIRGDCELELYFPGKSRYSLVVPFTASEAIQAGGRVLEPPRVPRAL